MPMDVHIDDLYELVDRQEMDGQVVNNIHFYRTGALYLTTYPTNAQLLAENWAAQILPDIAAIQNNTLAHRQISVRNLYDPADSFNHDVSVVGGIAGDSLGTFEAYAFKLAPDTAIVKPGSKRIAGVYEESQTNGVVTDAGHLASMADTSDALARAVQVGLLIPSDVFFPCIVKRVRTGFPGDYEYDLPAVRGEGEWGNIISALFDILITSQTSRKIGVGV